MNPKSEIKNSQSKSSRPKVLALSSTGGHWVQMLRLQPAFEDCDVTYATTNADYQSDILVDPEQTPREGITFRTIIDANRTQKFKLLLSLLSVAWVIISEKPDIILSTGAAPGFLAIRIGKLLAMKTIWIDSIANAEELSMSGKKAGKHASLWLTQWEHLAKPSGPYYYGNVLGGKNEVGEQKTDRGSRSSDVDTETSDRGSRTSGNEDPGSFRIFLTVGSDVPFDRMVKIVDQWAGKNPKTKVFAQIGRTTWQPNTIQYCQFLTPTEFTQKVIGADLILAHAGMGSILTALKHQKPILTMPRLGYLGETRNEHQTATAKYLSSQGKVNVVFNERSLLENLDNLDKLTVTSKAGPYASTTLTKQLKALIQN
jgi:UDP-N-acetylglucosamine transferase subunit ALG13